VFQGFGFWFLVFGGFFCLFVFAFFVLFCFVLLNLQDVEAPKAGIALTPQ